MYSKRHTHDLVITTYNSQKWIENIQFHIKIFKNDFDNIIISDDGSTDELFLKEISRLELINDNVTLIKGKENRGVSHARNIAWKVSESDYISFLDCDDKFDIAKALIVNQCIDKNEIDILFVKPKRNMKKESKRYEEEKLKVHCGRMYLLKSMYYTPCFTVRRDIMLETRGYNEHIRYGEDIELYIRLKRKYTFKYYEDELVEIEYPVLEKQKSLSSNQAKLRISIMKIFLREWKEAKELIYVLAAVLVILRWAIYIITKYSHRILG